MFKLIYNIITKPHFRAASKFGIYLGLLEVHMKNKHPKAWDKKRKLILKRFLAKHKTLYAQTKLPIPSFC